MSKKIYKAIRLEQFKGGLHLARGIGNSYDKSLEQLHSDTLKSAIFSCALQLFPELEDKENGRTFLESFKISSAFPFYKNKESIRYFLPKPGLSRLQLSIKDGKGDLVIGQAKKIKGVKYIELDLFQEIAAGANRVIDVFEDDIVGGFLSKKRAKSFKDLLEDESCRGIVGNKAMQHVYISADYSEDAKPFYVDKLYFHSNEYSSSGLYFLLDAESTDVEAKVMSAVHLLADSGLGMDRNTGNGQFTFDPTSQVEDLELTFPANADSEVNLSLYCPKKEEIKGDLEQSNFELTKRGGYISSPSDYRHLTIRKRSIYMFKEGGVFPKLSDSSRCGKLVDLKPDNTFLAGIEVNHPIWRDGQAIFFPFVSSKTND